MENLLMQQKPRHSKDIVFQCMPPDTVLLNLESGYYYSINSVGAEIWKLCDGKTDVAFIIDSLYQKYDVSQEQMTEDVVSFIQQVLGEKLIKMDDLK